MIKEHFAKFVSTVIAALPKMYGVQPVNEAMEAAAGRAVYTGDRHELAVELHAIIGNAIVDEQEQIKETQRMTRKYFALGANYRKHMMESLYNTCEIITEDLCAFGVDIANDEGASDFRELLQDVMARIETKYPRE